MKRLGLTSLLILTVACSTGGGLIKSDPSVSEVQQVRALAIRIADATTAGLVIVGETGTLIDALPIAPASKDAYDCGVLKVIGTNQAPSATVTKVCGAVPTKEIAPLAVALKQLGAVTSCPSLRTTAVGILSVIDPLIDLLAKSPERALVFAAVALRTTFAVTRTLLSGGPTCASI